MKKKEKKRVGNVVKMCAKIPITHILANILGLFLELYEPF